MPTINFFRYFCLIFIIALLEGRGGLKKNNLNFTFDLVQPDYLCSLFDKGRPWNEESVADVKSGKLECIFEYFRTVLQRCHKSSEGNISCS